MNEYQIQNPILKALSALILSVFGSWSEAAAFVATVYTILLLLEWIVKKVLLFRSCIKNKPLEDDSENETDEFFLGWAFFE